MHEHQSGLLLRLLTGESDTDDTALLAALDISQIAELIEQIHEFDQSKIRRCLKSLFDILTRPSRGTYLLALLQSRSPECVAVAYEQIYSLEAVQLHQYLVANNLEPTADDAVAYAISQLLNYTETIDHLRGWLRTIALRKAIQLKKKHFQPIPEGVDEAAGLAHWMEEQTEQSRSYASEIVAECRRSAISAEENQILEYYFFEERKGTDIATRMNIPKSTIYGRINGAVDKLRRCLESKAG